MRRRWIGQFVTTRVSKPAFQRIRESLRRALLQQVTDPSRIFSARLPGSNLGQDTNGIQGLVQDCLHAHSEGARLGLSPESVVSQLLWKRYPTLDESVLVYRKISRASVLSEGLRLKGLIGEILAHENPGPIDIRLLYEVDRVFDAQLTEAQRRLA